MVDKRRQAAALAYPEGEAIPSLVAQGSGEIADKIIALAEEAGVPVRSDPMLSAALSSLEMGSDIPPELYIAVAEALIWAWRIDNS
jgi:flagellar biosynthesis protein